MGQQALRQAHQPGGERRGVGGGAGRGLAQLPPRVPLGLQGGRAGRQPAQSHDRLHRLLRAPRLGLRPQDGGARHGEAARRALGGRQPRTLGLGGPRPARRRLADHAAGQRQEPVAPPVYGHTVAGMASALSGTYQHLCLQFKVSDDCISHEGFIRGQTGI